MHIRRLILTTIASLAVPCCSVMALELPPIDKPLPFGADVMGTLESTKVNETSPRTVQLLAAELARQGVPRERRAELAIDLGTTDLDAAVAPLAQAAGDDEAVVRGAVATALGNLKRPAGAEAIAKLVSDADARVRASAVVAAAAVGRGDLVTAGLNDADTTVVIAALSVATADQASAVAARLASPDETTRLLAITAVGRAGITAAGDDIARQLASEDVATQIAAVDALAALKATAHGAAIVDRLKHGHPSLRRAAVAALPSVLATADAQGRAIAMLSDADESVRTAAAEALAKVPGPAAIEPLVKQLSDPYVPLHTASRAALVAIGQPTVPAAVRLLDDAAPRRREDGSYLLGMLASHEGFERHVKLLEDQDWGVVAQAAESVGKIGDPAAGDALTATVARAVTAGKAGAGQATTTTATPWDAATNAIVAAGTLGHKPIGPAVANLIPERMTIAANVRAASIWAIGIVGVPNVDGVFGRFPGYIANLEESGDVKMEAVKAVGNLKYAKGLSWLKSDNPMMAESIIRALAHWSQDRIAGKVTPFELPPYPWQADVSVSDMKK